MIKGKLAYWLIYRVPAIGIRYNNSRKRNHGVKKIKSWILLLWLNIQYYILRNKKIEDVIFSPDNERRIVAGSESSKSFLGTPEAIAERLGTFDVISFDIFDTLIFRKVKHPTDVFFLMQKKMQRINLKKLRVEAEENARKMRQEKYGDNEVEIGEIWGQLAETIGVTVNEGVQLEMESEMEVCYANPFWLEVISRLCDMKKRIIVCSDMYIKKNQICDLLKNCGYPEFEKYYISCEFRMSKCNGDLYTEIKKELGMDTNIIHIGDNEFSDVKQAKKHGFNTLFYNNVQNVGGVYRAKDMSYIVSSIYEGIVNPHLHNGLNNMSWEYEFGYIYGGLFVSGFCQYIHEYVRTHNINKVLFLARDGDIIKKAYERMYPEEKKQVEYTYWSRLVGVKLCAKYYMDLFFERMLYHKVNQNYSIFDIFETMELKWGIDRFIKYTEKNYTPESYFDTDALCEIVSFLYDNWAEVCLSYEKETVEAKKYYEKIIGDASRVAIVDVGWVGTGPLTLKKLIEDVWKFDCSVQGIVAGSCSAADTNHDATAIEFADGTISSYLFSANYNRDLWKIHNAAMGHNMIIELLLSSSQQSFRGFMKDYAGQYRFAEHVEDINAEEIQKGILDFVGELQNHPFADINISGRDAMAPVILLYKNKAYMNFIINKAKINPNIE